MLRQLRLALQTGVVAEPAGDAIYAGLDLRVPNLQAGDVWARTMLRIEEAREAARLVGRIAGALPPGPFAVPLGPLENIVPDFPLRNKSFNLSYSGSDL